MRFFTISGQRAWGAPLLLLALLTGLAGWFYHATLSLPPAFHHAWAQADWLALAHGFLRNGFDFFHPNTLNLLTREGITGAGFPLYPYLGAVLMQLTRVREPGLLRLLTLLWSTAGLLALFALTRHASSPTPGAALKGTLAVLFVVCSPVYAYYQTAVLPSVPAFATALGGYYALWRAWHVPLPHSRRPAQRWLGAALFLLTLSAAMRTPFAIPLLATLGHLLWERTRTAARFGWKLVAGAYVLATLWLVGYYLYNDYLRQHYHGTMFLTYPLPPRSLAEGRAIADAVREKWGLALLSDGQWAALVAALLAALYLALTGRVTLRAAGRAGWVVNGTLLVAGGVAYSGLMATQYLDHDYYFIDSYLLPLALAFAGALALLPGLPRGWVRQGSLATGALLLTGMWVKAAITDQRQRYTPRPNDPGELTRANFTGAAAWLDSLGVPRQATLLVLDAYSFNLPLLLAERRGWTVLNTTAENQLAGLALPADYVITQDQLFASQLLRQYPLLPEELTRVAGNGRLTLWRPRRQPIVVSYRATTDLEPNTPPGVWDNVASTRTTAQAHSGRHSSAVAGTPGYSTGVRLRVDQVGLRAGDRIAARAWCWLPATASASLVVSLEDAAGGAPYFWEARDARSLEMAPERWDVLGGLWRLPAPHAPSDVLKMYVLKDGPGTLFVDDLSLTVVH